MIRLLKKGDRVRLNVETISGNKGLGTVIDDQLSQHGTVWMILDGRKGRTCCGREEISLLRDQNK
jgi:hypothetical protein